jgi:anti-sigma factor RsiW
MIKTLTHEDVIRYVYGECDAEEAQIIEAFIKTDANLYNYYSVLADTKKNLDGLNRQPSQEVVEKILTISREIDDFHSV